MCLDISLNCTAIFEDVQYIACSMVFHSTFCVESTDPLANSCHSKRGKISIISGGVSDGVSERHNTASHLKALSGLISSTDKQVMLVRQSAALCGCWWD